MEKDYNVFICYRGDGSVLASSIYSELCTYSKNKLRLFYAPKCLKYGENFMTSCKDVAGRVSLMMLILTKDFFRNCKNEDDVVYQELKSALANPLTTFLPIITPEFNFDDEPLSEIFDEQEIDRIKHISAIKYTDVYSFNSMDLLLPILKDKVGITDYDEIIQNELQSRQARMKSRVHIKVDGKAGFFNQDNKMEAARLETQQRLLYDFDMPVYEKYLEGKEEMCVLDVGCGNGRALMSRLGKRPEVKKIIGVEFDQTFVDKAKSDYAGSCASFYQADAEAPDFAERLREIMDENGIEAFDWINILAVMSHLKSPYQLLKTLRKFCHRGTVVFIRNIDDGLNLAHPDENMMFERAFNMIAKCGTTGYRHSGRELFTLLHRSGYRNISMERMGLNSSSMDYGEKEALFDTIFHFLKNSVNVTAANEPYNQEIQTEKEWLDEHFSELEENFLSADFFVNFGFVIVVATV